MPSRLSAVICLAVGLSAIARASGRVPLEAGLAARQLALAMARVHLGAGQDVLVPQFLGRVDFILTLERLCQEVGADFAEVALLNDPYDPDDVVRRFTLRAGAPGSSQQHRDAERLLQRSGGLAALPRLHEQMLEVLADRPGTRTVLTWRVRSTRPTPA